MGNSRSGLPDANAGTAPRHIAVIMDGNNRWARARGLRGSSGHKAGVEAIRNVLRCCERHSVDVLTLFAFSSENWQRPGAEVRALMRLFSSYLNSEVRKLHRDGVRVRFIGRRDRLAAALVNKMQYAEQLTAENRRSTLVIAVDYGGRWDLAAAARQLAEDVLAARIDPQAIDEQALEARLSLCDLPPVDLCIRTAGEQRISNFLLWQLAYAELYFCDTLWPDFDEASMDAAIGAYTARERRFGGRLPPAAEIASA